MRYRIIESVINQVPFIRGSSQDASYRSMTACEGNAALTAVANLRAFHCKSLIMMLSELARPYFLQSITEQVQALYISKNLEVIHLGLYQRREIL